MTHIFNIENETINNDGVKSVYNKEDNTLVNLGYNPGIKLVGEEQDGLVYPDIYNRLKEISDLYSSGYYINFSLSEDKAYIYYFNNLDNLIDFSYQPDTGTLWMEINKGRLIAYIRSRAYCSGRRGNVGPDGDNGDTGASASKEKFIILYENGSFTYNVNTPLNDQPVSVRVFDERYNQLSEILINLDGSFLSGNFKTYFSNLSFVNNVLIGTIKDTSQKVKARQRGSKGNAGKDGVDYIKVKSITDEFNLIYNSAISSVSLGTVTKNIIYRSITISPFNCVLSITPVTMPPGDNLVSVDVVTADCKDIGYYNYAITAVKPALNLPSWTPTSGCMDKNMYAMSEFEWYKDVNLPFEILRNPEPIMNSCKEPFWFCTNQICDSGVKINVVTKGVGEQETQAIEEETSES